MKTYSGHVENLEQAVIGLACTTQGINRLGKILVSESGTAFPFGYKAVVTGEGSPPGKTPCIRLLNLSDIADNDCIMITPDGILSVLWDVSSTTNSLLLTEACDCRCVMCPQPPKPHNDADFDIALKVLASLKPETVKTLCITGGEPTLLGDRFIDILRLIKKRFDHAMVLILSNGKNFADFSLAREYAGVGLSNATICISLHSDIEELSDKICGVTGSFHKTVQGIYNLARFRQRIEIRHVISRLNSHRLSSFAHFVYRNFPFAYHTAFMGMEVTGYASENLTDVWIDPYQYRDELHRAATVLHRAALDVSIYNIPLCLLKRESWPYARQSISEWKNSYVPECDGCLKKEACCGFFTTSGDRLSRQVQKIK